MQNNNIKAFFKDYPLYKEFVYTEDYLSLKEAVIDPFDFQGISFEYFCQEEMSLKTFELDLPNTIKEYYKDQSGVNIANECFDERKHLDYELHLLGICKSCQKKQADFLVSVKSDSKFPSNKLGMIQSLKGLTRGASDKPEIIKVFMKKIGVFPEPQVKCDPAVQKYFDRETNNWYYKGIKLYSLNFGIGSLAYFRRIIEKELLNILKDIGTLSSADPKLNKCIEKFEQNGKISSLYQQTFSLLPESLKLLGDNPFEILYRLTSKGLHDNMSEQECIEKADKIHKLLDFVVKKINEERSELLEIRNIIKTLKR